MWLKIHVNDLISCHVVVCSKLIVCSQTVFLSYYAWDLTFPSFCWSSRILSSRLDWLKHWSAYQVLKSQTTSHNEDYIVYSGALLNVSKCAAQYLKVHRWMCHNMPLNVLQCIANCFMASQIKCFVLFFVDTMPFTTTKYLDMLNAFHSWVQYWSPSNAL